MIYEIEYAEGKCKNYANGRKDLIDWLRLLREEQVTDIRKVYQSGNRKSVLERCRQYLSK